MTREEFEYAIKSCGCFIYRGQTYYEESELIKAFEDMGLIEQEPSGDAVSRQWLMRKATEKFYTTNYFNHITKMIEEAPSVNPQPICEEREKGECPWYAG